LFAGRSERFDADLPSSFTRRWFARSHRSLRVLLRRPSFLSMHSNSYSLTVLVRNVGLVRHLPAWGHAYTCELKCFVRVSNPHSSVGNSSVSLCRASNKVLTLTGVDGVVHADRLARGVVSVEKRASVRPLIVVHELVLECFQTCHGRLCQGVVPGAGVVDEGGRGAEGLLAGTLDAGETEVGLDSGGLVGVGVLESEEEQG